MVALIAIAALLVSGGTVTAASGGRGGGHGGSGGHSGGYSGGYSGGRGGGSYSGGHGGGRSQAEETGAEGIADAGAVGGTEEDTDGMEEDIGTVVGIGPTSVSASPQGQF